METKIENKNVNVEEILKKYKVTNKTVFISYLKEVWTDLVTRSDNKKLGINKLTFSTYYKLPGIISERLFRVLNKSNTNYLDSNEFITGLKTLFCETFDENSRFIFDFYDFDKDGIVSKEDIRVVLSYVTLQTEEMLSPTANNYNERVKSQDELFDILNKCFAKNETEQINYKQFVSIIENINSDIYFLILLFLYEKKPFTKVGLSQYEKQNKKASTNTLADSPAKFVRQPSRHSTFSSCFTFLRSPIRRKTIQANQPAFGIELKSDSKAEGFTGRTRVKTKTMMMKDLNNKSEKGKLLTEIKKNFLNKGITDFSVNENEEFPVHRKEVINLKEMDMEKNYIKRNSDLYSNIQIQPAVKMDPKHYSQIRETNSSIKQEGKEEDKIFDFESDDDNSNSFHDDENIEEENVIKHEGYLFKLVDTQMKKLYFKLLHNDLYYFKTSNDTQHKGLHNLSGVFIEEKPKYSIHNKMYYCFALVFPKKTREYYTETEKDHNSWVEALKAATGYTNLTDIYEIGPKIGKGKFGIVKLCTNKETKKKCAIKILCKTDMKQRDLELVRTEVEILKICQHPNIISLIDTFENVSHLYIIMEYCSGGDLFSYIEKRGFKLSEAKTCEIIHKILMALFYIHSYGVVHRDLKPENILMTDDNDEADIRILDFGLSKILGPEEKCTEPYGTLSYCAPEVLLEVPYNKAVDLWSVGVITYLLLSGSLPFDHQSSEKEVARQTINDPVPFKGSIWKIISKEAKEFIEGLLQKKPESRLNVKEALEHKWFVKFYQVVVDTRKDGQGSFFHKYSSTGNIDA